MIKLAYLLLAFILCPAAAAQAQAPVMSLQATVTGNQEQPKVLYILPWQRADRLQQQFQSQPAMVEELFQPVDREEFLRGLNYRKQYQPPSGELLPQAPP